jgi:hypothetical protein
VENTASNPHLFSIYLEGEEPPTNTYLFKKKYIFSINPKWGPGLGIPAVAVHDTCQGV